MIIVAVFSLVAADYAGRQLIARLGDLLGDVLALVAPRDQPPPPLARAIAIQRDIGFSVADILRLVNEARLEGRHAGIAPEDAVETAGLAQRIAYRAVAICRTRNAPGLPPLSDELRRALVDLTAALRSHLDILHRVLLARHTTARPGTARLPRRLRRRRQDRRLPAPGSRPGAPHAPRSARSRPRRRAGRMAGGGDRGPVRRDRPPAQDRRSAADARPPDRPPVSAAGAVSDQRSAVSSDREPRTAGFSHLKAES